jgi:hypothetical protein
MERDGFCCCVEKKEGKDESWEKRVRGGRGCVFREGERGVMMGVFFCLSRKGEGVGNVGCQVRGGVRVRVRRRCNGVLPAVKEMGRGACSSQCRQWHSF